MKRFKDIPCFADGTDPEPRTPGRAAALAGAKGAWLTVVDVVPEARLAGTVEALKLDRNGIRRRHRQEALEARVVPHTAARTTIHPSVYQGTPFREVIHAVLENGYDPVVKSAHAPGGPRDRLLGSADMHLLRVVNTAEKQPQGCRTSVLTVKPAAFGSPVRHPEAAS